MPTPTPFDDLPVLGRMPLRQAAAKLRELGVEEAADALEMAEEESAAGARTFGAPGDRWPFQDRAWQHTAHAFGYLAPAAPGDTPLPIHHAGSVPADPTLGNARVNVKLERLRVAEYPGRGTHRVLLDFSAQNQLPGLPEQVHFSAAYAVRQGQEAAVAGHPIFLGLNVGTEGVAFRCSTVNVQNEEDEALLSFLESGAFRTGLLLASVAQPAIGLLSQMVVGITRALAGRRKNVRVQDFYLGLDFAPIPTGARLAEGAYLAVQIPESLDTVWDWSQWVYDRRSGQVVSADDPSRMIPYNYLVFSVTRYQGT